MHLLWWNSIGWKQEEVVPVAIDTWTCRRSRNFYPAFFDLVRTNRPLVECGFTPAMPTCSGWPIKCENESLHLHAELNTAKGQGSALQALDQQSGIYCSLIHKTCMHGTINFHSTMSISFRLSNLTGPRHQQQFTLRVFYNKCRCYVECIHIYRVSCTPCNFWVLNFVAEYLNGFWIFAINTNPFGKLL